MSAISAHELGHSFGRQVALNGIDLTFGKGELTVIVGPNGAGKSTLLRLLMGFMPPTRGRIEIDGVPLDGLSRREIARRLAFVPQGFHTEFALTARQIVEMGRTAYLGRLASLTTTDREAIDSALEATETRALADRLFIELSGGEQQRVLLARAFAQGASILILDEPTANLDIAHAYRFFDLVRIHVRKGGTVIAALHDLAFAAELADRIIVLHHGKVHADGSADVVLTSDVIRDAFGIDAEIRRSETGSGLVVRRPA